MLYFTIEKRLQDRIGEGPRSGGCEMTILSSDIVGLSSDILESSFLLAGSKSGIFRWHVDLRISWQAQYFGEVGGWLYLLHALEMTFHMWVGGVGTQIIDDIHFAWQAPEHLVRLEGDFTCSTHWKWRFICDADHWWHSFSVAGAVFWWSWRVALVALRIGNDFSYVMRDHWWHSFCVASAVFGEVGRWLLLRRAL